MTNIPDKVMIKARKMSSIFLEVASYYEFDDIYHKIMKPHFGENWFAVLLGGIAFRESHFGLLLINGLGDSGHGHGIMQIDDRSHGEWIRNHNWRDPATNIEYGADVWLEDLEFFDLHGDLVDHDTIKEIWAATAAFNCGAGNVRRALRAGRDVDHYTTGKNYSADIRSIMVYLRSQRWPT